jgi:putative transposase
MKYRLIEAEKAEHSISRLCKVLGVTRQGFHAWRRRGPSLRQLGDAELKRLIVEIHDGSHQIYGAVRIHGELRDEHEVRVGRKRVARLMRELGIQGVSRRGRKPRTTISAEKPPPAPDLVERKFVAERPNALWLADITYVETRQGYLFLAVVMDMFSRKIVGWSMRDDLRAELVVDALAMAITRRRPPAGLIHHSDRGSQGGFNRSSQHLVMEVMRDGCSGASAGGSGDARSDVVAGPAVGGPAGGSAAILASDRGRVLERGRGCRGGCVASGWQPVVSRRWRDASNLVGPAVGALPLVCRAGRDRDSSRAACRRTRDRSPAETVPIDDLEGAAP